MADVGSLGQYKVVVTADYSQLQAQFKAMADLVNQTAKTMSQSLDNAIGAMSTNMVSQLNTMTNTMRNAFSGAEGVVRNFNSTIQSAGQTAETVSNTVQRSSEGFASYARQIQQAQAEIQNINRAMQQMRLEMARGVNPEGANVDAYRRLEQELQRVRVEYNRLRDTATQGERQIDREQQNTHTRQSRRISQLATQYRVAYEEINKYLQSHTKMSEAVFIRLQGKITSYGNQLREISAIPQPPNPLEGMDYDKYSSQFSKWTDFFASLKHHLTWMASATAIGTVIGVPAATIHTIAEVEKQMAQMRQVNKEVHDDQVLLNKTAQEFIGIAQEYGESVENIIEAGVLWGRQYKDLNEVMKLTTLSAKLAVADNMDVSLANRAVESVINGYQKQGQAIQFANHVVDSWTKIAHNAQSSATDLAEALMRTGAAAKAVGVDFDTTNALASAMIKSTGRSGAEVGRMIAA